MLSKEDNELLTRTTPGTPMGNLIRRYWVPALLSEEIPGSDCPPVRVKLLGEELVAFRDTQGRIGLIGEHCAHRGTSLFFGHNEECGLRCIYHGWKYDVEGNVLDTPAEPADSDFRKKLRHTAYPTHEANGVIYTYLGAREKMPVFPNYEWTQVPPEYAYVTKNLLECNYLQGLEGECDSSHLSFLHRAFTNERNQLLYKSDTSPAYETEDTDFGVRLIATRDTDSQHYVRFSAFVMPVYGCVPAGRPTSELEGYEIHTYVPADDTHCWRYDIGFRRDRAVRDDEVHRRKQINPDYTRIRNARNNYLQDRQMQKTVNFTGIEDFLNHDACATESMGRIFDRSKEHLGVSDKAVIAVRKFLLTSVKELQTGKEPAHVVRDMELNWFPHIDCFAHMLPRNVTWRQHFDYLTASAKIENPASYAARRKAAS
ncbi:MAG TPA: Rieske 2Fe-2S domain-containing protein [Candidatus Binatia bacterium]|jgi:phenylpropionate dioxygenase-like ring-hydroxylating dioxygenase large terminal subunit|nr:Rieske 2Fe-2S domain-containing protein [Candidatus Binatia bacterium]